MKSLKSAAHMELESQLLEVERGLAEQKRREQDQRREWRLCQKEIDKEMDELRRLIADRLGLPVSKQMEKLKRLCQDPGSGEDA